MEDIISQAHAIGHYIFISTDSVFMACDRVRVLAYQVFQENAAQTSLCSVSECAFLGTFPFHHLLYALSVSEQNVMPTLYLSRNACVYVFTKTHTQGSEWVAGRSCHPTTI